MRRNTRKRYPVFRSRLQLATQMGSSVDRAENSFFAVLLQSRVPRAYSAQTPNDNVLIVTGDVAL